MRVDVVSYHRKKNLRAAEMPIQANDSRSGQSRDRCRTSIPWPHNDPQRSANCASLLALRSPQENGSTQGACSWMQEMNTIVRAHN
jgi:hypothetical protein